MRRFQRQTELRLVVAVVVFLTIVGNGLVWLFMGQEIAMSSIMCSVGGALLFGGLYGLMALLERWSEKRDW
jgi:hypothetical protein